MRISRIGMIVGAGLALAMAASMALAQTVVEPVPIIVTEPTLWQQLWTGTIQPAVMSIGGIIITAAVAYAVKLLRDKTGIDFAAKEQMIGNLLQEAFQGAVGRGAGLAINELGAKALDTTKLGDEAVTKGLAYVKATMPDTIKKIGASDDTIRKAIVAQIGEKTAPALAQVLEFAAGSEPKRPPGTRA